MRWVLLALLTLGPVSAARVTYCPVQVLPDQHLGIVYKALLRVDPLCPDGGVARVRKASTLNRGAAWRPQKPDGSPKYGGLWGWSLKGPGSPVPGRELWTLSTWVWQYWDGAAWRRVTRP